jgi:uncharacterized protein (UPF0548 family)
MAEWRLFNSWSPEAIKARLEEVKARPLNFDAAEEEMTGESGWHHYHSEAVIAREPQGDECFKRASVALANYQFSDPGIVLAHFEPDAPLLNRRILLEIQVLGLHYLCPASVNRVRQEPNVFGFRYDTVEGHIERGVEWFLLTKNQLGEIRFRIEARWRRGAFPNWWSRIGFIVLSGYYQRKWHRRAHNRLSLLAHYGSTRRPRADAAGLTHQGIQGLENIDVVFTYHTKRKWL